MDPCVIHAEFLEVWVVKAAHEAIPDGYDQLLKKYPSKYIIIV